MRKLLVVGGIGLVAVGAIMVARRIFHNGYEHEAIDSAGGQGSAFGRRDPDAMEQRWAPAETRTDFSPEELSTAARVGSSKDAIRAEWPSISEDDIEANWHDLDRLAMAIAGRVNQPVDETRRRLDEILARETPRPSYPAL